MAKALSTVFCAGEFVDLSSPLSHCNPNEGEKEELVEDMASLGSLSIEEATNITVELAVPKPAESVDQKATAGGPATCVTCGVGCFNDVEEQREHFKSDWHRYNVKLRVQGKGPVPEDAFIRLIEDGDDVGSISGSDDEIENEGTGQETRSLPFFVFRGQGSARALGVWKSLAVPDNSSKQTDTNMLREKGCLELRERLCRLQKDPGEKWLVVMQSGGHFSALIVQVASPPAGSKASADGRNNFYFEKGVKELEHKSFHRYVVRAKSGGKQSTKDATGKFAKSAGSRLRRYNEEALHNDIVDLLQKWKPLIDECSLILVSAPGSKVSALFSGENAPLDKMDCRVRRIPFVVRRPTLSEARRIVRLMLTLYDVDELVSDIASYTQEIKKKSGINESKKSREKQMMDRERKKEEEREAIRRQQEISYQRNKEKKKKQKERKKQRQRDNVNENNEVQAEQRILKKSTDAHDDIDEALKMVAMMAKEYVSRCMNWTCEVQRKKI